MNTTSLILTGQTAHELTFGSVLFHKYAAMGMTTTLTRTPTDLKRTPTMSRSGSRSSSRDSASSSSTIRPGSHRRTYSKDSSGWYNAEDNLTLEDFAARLDSMQGRVEQWISQCATNIVMALFRPTPLVLFLFNPVCLLFIAFMVVIWMLFRGSGVS
jgi:hypothetical protein